MWKGIFDSSELTIIQVNDILTVPLLNMLLEQNCLRRDRDLYHKTSRVQNWDQMTGKKQHRQVYLSPRKKENTNNDLRVQENKARDKHIDFKTATSEWLPTPYRSVVPVLVHLTGVRKVINVQTETQF